MSADGPPFTCPRCGAVSHHPDDMREGYCGRCHEYTGPRRRADVWGDACAAAIERVRSIRSKWSVPDV